MKNDLAELMYENIAAKDDDVARAMENVARAASLFKDCGFVKEAAYLQAILNNEKEE